MARGTTRITVVIAVVGMAAGLSGLVASVEAAPCATENTVGEVILPGVGSADVDTGPNTAVDVCVGTLDTSVQVFKAGIDYPGDYFDTAVKACVSMPTDPPCTYDTSDPAIAYAGVANEDMPQVATTSDGIAVVVNEGTSWETLVVTALGEGVRQEAPRVCVEVGSARCESASPILPQ